ncbi:putative Serine/threonine-protein kinase PBS1 [Hibiscus syriacus]|uniref:Serine/threonine-protein kinase PBS1 n=1 Tax=Hibiscus syriacus TaxID=106335 RepID=A0A6A3CK45_HIBSY|nr:splicing factor, arginine/serine-rich 19-like [Hibiscus syriacus]KAE8727952.1 putative Serine/threonine-protein kinase PBS1 [Hibiscus syriacus]
MTSSICLSVFPPSKTLAPAPSTSKSRGFRCSLVVSVSKGHQRTMGKKHQVVCMAPEEEKLTRRNPLDFPIEWERPKPGRRPDIFPQFSPMKTPLPPPMPYDPPEEDEEEEEKKEEEEEEEEPEKEEEPDNPEKQS